MSEKTYQFYCDHCGYKRITDGTDIQDLREIKTSPVSRGGPSLDPTAKKTITSGGLHQPGIETSAVYQPKPILQPKKFKCPKCGYVIKARQIKLAEYDPLPKTNQPDGSQASPPGPSLPGELT